MISRGYVAVFAEPHSDASIRTLVASWLDRFSRVEQVIPGAQAGNSTVTLTSSGELLPSDHLQFRIIQGDDFCWAYLTRGRCVIETTGLPSEKMLSVSTFFWSLMGSRKSWINRTTAAWMNWNGTA